MLFCRVNVLGPLKRYKQLCHSSAKLSPVSVTKEVVSKQICLRKASPVLSNKTTTQGLPLVLLFPWLTAPAKVLDRYCDLYHQRGWDVLTVQGEMQHFLRPRKAVVVAQDIMAFLTEHQRPLLVHAMSIGAYLFTVFTMELQKDPDTLSKLLPMFRGQVFDSIVIGGLGRMSTGIAATFTDNPVLRAFITGTSSLYFALTKKHTVAFYNDAVDAFYTNPIKGPVLFFYSLDDPMSDHKSMEHLIGQWSQGGSYDVKSKSWNSSPHAGHLRAHREEYLETLGMFIETLNMK